MCGIVAVVRDHAVRQLSDVPGLIRAFDDVGARLQAATTSIGPTLEHAAVALAAVDRELIVHDGVAALLADPVARGALAHRADMCIALVNDIEARLDDGALAPDQVEAINYALIACKDAL